VSAERRILSVITRLIRGGSDRRLYDVLRAVPAVHTVVVGGDSDPSAVDELAAHCDEVVWCPDLRRAVEPRRDVKALRFLRRQIREGGYDVVHTHQAKSGLLGRVAAWAGGVRLVYHSASGASFGPGYGRLESLGFAVAERLTAPLVTTYFVVGADLLEQLAANGVSRRRLVVVRSSLDLTPFLDVDRTDSAARADRRDRLGLGVDDAVVCYVGRVDQFKGVGSLGEILAGAATTRARAGDERPVALVVVGDGPMTEELGRDLDEGPAARAGVRSLRLGHLADLAQVADVMAASDVLVLPSPKEGLSQVLVQASAAGLPFVSFEVDGVTELRALGARGRAVPLGDVTAFADAVAIELAADATGPRPERSTWADWDPEVVAARYRAHYERDLGRVAARGVSARRAR
jgi:glycosyltransferase involved in cell wall biosynthesis